MKIELSQREKTEALIWFCCFTFGFLDLVTTFIGLENGLVEQNPIGRYLLQNFGFYSLAIMKFGIIIMLLFLTKKILWKKWKYMPPTILSLIWMGVVIINTTTIIRVV